MNALKYIRDYYTVPAHRGHRIRYTYQRPVEGIILGGKNGKLRVRFDGTKRTVLLHPQWMIKYIQNLPKAP